MREIKIKRYYDEEGDIFYLELKSANSVKGIQLTENIVLRIEPDSGEALGLAIHNYTKLATHGVADPLTRLSIFDDEPLLRILTSEPFDKLLVLQGDVISLGPALMPQPVQAI